MANVIGNQQLGRLADRVANVEAGTPANSALIIVVLETGQEADGVLRDYDDLGALLAPVANTEHASFARKTLTAVDGVARIVDDVANDVDLDFSDLVYTAPPLSATATGKLIVCYDADTTVGTDANIEVLAIHDFVVTPDGNDVTVTVPANGFAGAS